MGKSMTCQGETVKTEIIHKMKKLRKFVSKAQHHCPKHIANFSSTFEGIPTVQIEPRGSRSTLVSKMVKFWPSKSLSCLLSISTLSFQNDQVLTLQNLILPRLVKSAMLASKTGQKHDCLGVFWPFDCKIDPKKLSKVAFLNIIGLMNWMVVAILQLEVSRKSVTPRELCFWQCDWCTNCQKCTKLQNLSKLLKISLNLAWGMLMMRVKPWVMPQQ